MKRLKRVGAILMALALVIGLLPAGVFHTHAHAAETQTPLTPIAKDGKTWLHAVYVANGITLDGVREYSFPLSVALSADTMIGAAWDLEYLYFAVNSDVAFTQLKVNGVNVVTSKVTAATDTDPGFAEYQISLSDAGISSIASGVNKVTVQVGEESVQTLHLIFDNNNYARQTLGSNNKVEVIDDYTARANYDGSIALYNGNAKDVLKGDLNNAAVVEFDLDIDQIFYNSGTSDDFVTDALSYSTYGINVQVLDEYCKTDESGNIIELFKFGFFRSILDPDKGAMYFRHVYEEDGTLKCEDVPVADTDDRLVHVRVEYTYAADANGEISHDSVVSAKYFINGMLLAEATNVRNSTPSQSVGTTAFSQVRVLVNYGLETRANSSKVTSSNYSISYGDTAELSDLAKVVAVQAKIAEIGANGTITQAEVDAAQDAFDALDAELQALVSNSNELALAQAWLTQPNYLHAVYAEGDQGAKPAIVVGGTKVSAAWDWDNLYLTGATKAVIGKAEADATEGQIIIPWAEALGVCLTEEAAGIPRSLTLTVGDKTWTGTLVLDTNDYVIQTVLSIAYGTVKEDTGVWRLNSANPNSATDSSQRHRDILYNIGAVNTTNWVGKLQAALNRVNIVEMDVQTVYMPDSHKFAAGGQREFAYGGLSIVVIDGESYSGSASTEGMLTGLVRTGSVLYLGYWNGESVTEVPIDVYQSGKEYHLRIEYTYPEAKEDDSVNNDIVNVKYFVNGKLVAEDEDVKIINGKVINGKTYTCSISSGSDGSGPNGIFIQTTDLTGATPTNENTRAEAVVKNISVSNANAVNTGAEDNAGCNWNAGEVTTAPGCTTEGVKTFTCGTCNATKTDPVDATGHSDPLTAVDAKVATCEEAGHKAYWYCGKCEKYFADAEAENEIGNIEAWLAEGGQGYLAKKGHQYDENGGCTLGCNKTKCDNEGHAYGTLIPAQAEVHTPTVLKASVAAHYICSNCGEYFNEYKELTTLEQLTGETPNHTSGDWQWDNENHWKACTCGLRFEEAEHSFETEQDTDCDCGYTREVHVCTGTLVEGQEATCTEPGWNDYYECSCKKLYEDAECQREIMNLEAWKQGDGMTTKDHTPGAAVEENRTESTCTVAGSYESVVYCSVCKTYEISRVPKALELAAHDFDPITGECANCDAVNGELTFVAQVGMHSYTSLQAAIDAADDGDTITLLMSISGAGIVIDKSITIDFGGYTYTFNSPAVGSSGTQTLGFQILKNNTVVLRNGKLEVAETAKTDFAFLIQNYADLTVSGMTLDGTNLDRYTIMDYNYSYVLSNNSGNVAIVDTTIIVNDDGDAYAFDACKYLSYAVPTVTVSGTSNISGIIQVTGGNLVLNDGTFTGKLVYASGAVTKAETVELDAPADYKWVDGVLTAKDYVAQIGEDKKFESLKAAVEAAEYGDVITLLKGISGAGIVIDKSITIDFGGYTYTFNSPAVGSSGTQTQGFQILKNNTVVLRNGKLEVAETAKTDFAFLIQNYADLTVSGMTLDGTNLDRYTIMDYNYSYVLSNNSGNVAIVDTTIIVNDDGDAYAFDACKYLSYAVPTVTVSGTSNISGIIQVTGGNLVLNDGTFTGELVYTSGSVTKAETVGLAAPEDYCWNAAGVLGAHVGGEAVEKNRTESTCTVAGSYDAVVYCAHCGEELSRETVDLPLAEHTAGAAVEKNRTESTCTVAGSYDAVVYCSVCGTHEISRETVNLPLAEHTAGAAVEENRVESTCTVAGSYDAVVYCSVCGTHEISRETVNLPLAEHTAGAAVEENRVESTCTVAGSYDVVVYCSVCGTHEISRETVNLPLAEHNFVGGKCDVCGNVDPDFPVIDDQPEDYVCKVGDVATFSVVVIGDNVTYQWYFSSNAGKGWAPVTGGTDATYSVEFKAYRANYQYRCVITDVKSGGTIISDAATLKADQIALEITGQPQDQVVNVGDTVVFEVAANGNGLQYRWYYSSDNGATWKETWLEGYNTNKLSVTAAKANAGYQYKCIVTDVFGENCESAIAKLSLSEINISEGPQSAAGVVGDTVTFTVEATGYELQYQWYFSTDNNTWKKSELDGNGTANLVVPVLAYRDGQRYMCVVTDGNGNTKDSSVAVLTLKTSEVTITAQPESVTNGILNAPYEFKVEATGDNLTYRWYYSTDNGENWMETWLEGYNTDTLKVELKSNRNGNLYRCEVTSGVTTATSEAAKLSLAEINISEGPQSAAGVVGDTVTFTVEATGYELQYQWYFSTDNNTWKKSELEGNGTANLVVPVLAYRDGQRYMCVVTDGNGNTKDSSVAVLTLKTSEVTITAQPESVTDGILNAPYEFKVEATGDNLTYRWYYSTDNGENWMETWLEGYNTDTLKVELKSNRNGNLYRCVVTSGEYTATSEAATLSLA